MTDSKMPERILAANYGQWFIRDTTGTLTAYRRADLAHPAPVAVAELDTCGVCCGTGTNGHPDSGYVCYECNGSGGVPLRARTAQPVGVRVKPLTWHPGHGCTGSGLGLEYHMGETDPGMFELYSPIKFGPASKAECQAAAQADYEQRILSALLPEGGA